MKEPLLLGVATEVISPKPGVDLYGYNPRPSTSIHDDLTATAFYFCQGETQALLVSLTICMLHSAAADELLNQIQERFGINRSNCIIHTTHTHSGPATAAANAPQEQVNAIYNDYITPILFPNTLKAIERAMEHPVEVVMSYGVGESEVGVGRREITTDSEILLGQNPWAAIDKKMTVLSFMNLDGKIVANIVHYGAHGTACGKNAEISRDWPGVMCDILTEATGGMTAFFNGTEGDVSPRMFNGDTMGGHHVRYAVQHGSVAGYDAVRIQKATNGYNQVDLDVSCQTIRVPMKPRIPQAEVDELAEQFRNGTLKIHDARVGKYYERVSESYRNGYEEMKTLDFDQTVIRLGDVAFVSLPFEVFSETGLRISYGSKVPHTLTVSLCNGSFSYFVTQDQLCRGGYEVDIFGIRFNQKYADHADDVLVKQTVEHVNNIDYKENHFPKKPDRAELLANMQGA